LKAVGKTSCVEGRAEMMILKGCGHVLHRERKEEMLGLTALFLKCLTEQLMKAAWYEKQGAARDVLTIGEMGEPQPLNTRWFLWRKRFHYPRMRRLSRGPASEFPASPLIGLFT
jgi:hypothetical protein